MAFPTTHWSQLAAATVRGERSGRDALNELCRGYRAPVLAFFRSKCRRLEDAEDLTQALFQQIIELRAWQRADPAKGRFRTYLLSIANNALRNWLRAAAAAKRGGQVAVESVDLLAESGWEPAAPEDDAVLSFDREWARTTLAAAWKQVQASHTTSEEKSARFEVLRRFLPGTSAPPTYEAAATSLQTSVEHLKTLIHRLRGEFAEALRAEVAGTVDDPADLHAEMNHLRAVMTARDEVANGAAADFLKHGRPD